MLHRNRLVRGFGASAPWLSVLLAAANQGCSGAAGHEAPRENIAASQHALVSPAFAPHQPNIKWHGRIQAAALDPANPNFVIAASDHGGAFRSEDGGATWSHLDGLRTYGLADVAICAEDPREVVITSFQGLGTTWTNDSGGIWRSHDRGNTWTHLRLTGFEDSPHAGFGVTFLPGSGCQTLYAGTSFGLARCTTDPSVPDAPCENTALPEGGPVIAVQARPGPIVHTHTATGYRRWNGSAWNALCNPVDPSTPCPGGLVPSPAIGVVIRDHTLAVSPFNEQVLFGTGLAMKDGKLGCGGGAPGCAYEAYESDDGGDTWVALGAAVENPGGRMPFVYTVPTRIPGRPSDFDLYFGHGVDISRTTCTESGGGSARCAGASFEHIGLRPDFAGDGGPPDGSGCGDNGDAPCPHEDPSEVLFDPVNHCPLWIASDGGMLKLAADAVPPDCGKTKQWFTFGTGLNALQLFEVTGQVHPAAAIGTDLFFGTQDNGIWASTDSGATWPRPGGLEGGALSVPHSAPDRENTIVTYGDGGGLGLVEAHAGFTPNEPLLRATSWSQFGSGNGKNRVTCADLDGDNHCDGVAAAVLCNTTSSLPNHGVHCITSACTDGNSDALCDRLEISGGEFPVALAAGVYVQWDGGAVDASGKLVSPIQLNLSLDGGATWTPLANVKLGTVGDDVNTVRKPWGLAQIATDASGKFVTYHQTQIGNDRVNGMGLVRVVDPLGANPTLEFVDDGLPSLHPDLLYSSAFMNSLSFGVDARDANRLLAGTMDGVRKSTDGGKHWIRDAGTRQLDRLVAGRHDVRNLLSFGFDLENSQRMVVGTAEAGAMSTLDGGQTWARLCQSDRVPLQTRFFFDDVEHHVYVSSWGRGLWTTDLTRQQIPAFTTPPPNVRVQNCGAVDVGQAQAADQCEDTPVAVSVQAGLGAVPPDPSAGCDSGIRPCGNFSRGDATVVWTATDDFGDTATTTSSVTVDDRTPPALTPVQAVTLALCNPDGEQIQLVPPTANDRCIGPVAVTGQVIASDSMAVPFPLTNGRAALRPGTHTVRWTASDGITSASETQQIVVRPGVFANRELNLADRARVRLISGAPGGLSNAGGLLTHLGTDTATGSILSVARIEVGDRSRITGSLTSRAAINRGNQVVVTGAVRPFSNVVLPPFPTLSDITFPAPTGVDTFVNAGQAPALAPGSYRNFTLNSGGTLRLRSGDYFFLGLTLNSASSVVLDQSAGPVRIFIANTLVFRGAFRTPAGALADTFLGYRGTTSVFFEAPFNGTVLAPNARVELGSDGSLEFRGRFSANTLALRPGTTLTCLSQNSP